MKKAIVGNILLDKIHNSPVVELKVEEIKRNVYIWIGACEAWALAMAMEHIEIERPLTHDLILKTYDIFKYQLVRIVISEINAGTYYSKVILEPHADNPSEGIIEMDCRPSDALVLAVKKNVPIYISSDIIVNASVEDTPDYNKDSETNKFKEFIETFNVEELKKYLEEKNEDS